MVNVEIVKSKKTFARLGGFIVNAVGLCVAITPIISPYLVQRFGEGSLIVTVLGGIIIFSGTEYFQNIRGKVGQLRGVTKFANGNLDDIPGLPEDAREYYNENLADEEVDNYTSAASPIVSEEKQ